MFDSVLNMPLVNIQKEYDRAGVFFLSLKMQIKIIERQYKHRQ